MNGHWCALRNFGGPLKHLKSITYRDMLNVTDKALWYLLKPIGGNIREADFHGCRRFKGRFLRLFGSALNKVSKSDKILFVFKPSLSKNFRPSFFLQFPYSQLPIYQIITLQLLLDECHRVDKESLEDLCLESPNVTELRVSGCWHISDETLRYVTSTLGHECKSSLTPSLYSLYFLFTLIHFSIISRNMTRLETFALCGDRFYAITPVGLMAITRLQNLVELSLVSQ